MLVEPASNAASQRLRDVPQAKHVTLVVGPEGGWDPEEIQAAAGAGIILATLGEQTLRADAVPLVALTAVRVLWGDL
jgi:16S rRNA (uracil1498-N3)-methyltransferase